MLPKALDEEVARAHCGALGIKLSTLTPVQSEYLGLPTGGPYKMEHYRWVDRKYAEKGLLTFLCLVDTKCILCLENRKQRFPSFWYIAFQHLQATLEDVIICP